MSITDFSKMANKPKDCPFCGSSNLRIQGQGLEGVYYVECKTCGCAGPDEFGGPELAANIWNNRACDERG